MVTRIYRVSCKRRYTFISIQGVLNFLHTLYVYHWPCRENSIHNWSYTVLSPWHLCLGRRRQPTEVLIKTWPFVHVLSYEWVHHCNWSHPVLSPWHLPWEKKAAHTGLKAWPFVHVLDCEMVNLAKVTLDCTSITHKSSLLCTKLTLFYTTLWKDWVNFGLSQLSGAIQSSLEDRYCLLTFF